MKIIEIFSMKDEAILKDKSIIGSNFTAKEAKTLLINEHLTKGNPEGWARRFEVLN